jgi:hypothetical protein
VAVAPAFGYTDQRRLARSRTPLIQAARAFPALAAAASYLSLRSLDQRISYRSSSGFSIGGLPLGLLGCSMAFIMPVQIILDKLLDRVFNVRTVTQPLKELQMLKVTFKYVSRNSKKEFFNTELHRSMEDARIRALALNCQIWKVEAA